MGHKWWNMLHLRIMRAKGWTQVQFGFTLGIEHEPEGGSVSFSVAGELGLARLTCCVIAPSHWGEAGGL